MALKSEPQIDNDLEYLHQTTTIVTFKNIL